MMNPNRGRMRAGRCRIGVVRTTQRARMILREAAA